MAIKQKQVEQKSKLLEVLTTEYKWENLLLGILATLSGALALVIYPFFLPALPELKKITWPTLPKFVDHAVRTLIFLFFLTGFILLFNMVATALISGGI